MVITLWNQKFLFYERVEFIIGKSDMRVGRQAVFQSSIGTASANYENRGERFEISEV